MHNLHKAYAQPVDVETSVSSHVSMQPHTTAYTKAESKSKSNKYLLQFMHGRESEEQKRGTSGVCSEHEPQHHLHKE